ncbi:hypothetical protein D3OALGA1CA_310 [Olavius algarvensis associated proteobacterium Delta 3]|nr:hypothetical protein D3OALGA1CA_310 [Olavius algarvensis associated proteobacterium Delta 3]
MPKVIIEDRGKVAVVRLENSVINAISRDLVEGLLTALEEVKGRFKGMVLCGGEKFFCIGLALPELLTLDRRGMSEFWNRLDEALLTLYRMPMPTAAAIAGHATAGGTILGLACDYRFAAEGRTLVGLNEITIGVPVPFLADLMLRQVVGERIARDIAYTGDLMAADAAVGLGLIDEVHPKEDVEEAAVGKVLELSSPRGPAFSFIKEFRTEALGEYFISHREEKKERLLDCWFDPKVQRMLTEAAKKF